MLKLLKINKDYIMPNYEVNALQEVDLNFRRNEFVSVLGPSGSGKTTLLNIVGGLDKYTSGDLIINGISTKTFTDKDWDVYRNHRIGFVFQNYNLIPHQTVLKNVELALTIAGLGKEERVKRSKDALDKVGLHDQYTKKPNQLSGGQKQRVAIARALVNDPDILLADEPTGALDTETSQLILDLIQEISKEKLVIMVTHNDVLAKKYSTRIIKLLDGRVIDDSNPLTKEELETAKEEVIVKTKKLEKKNEKAKMSLLTTFLLSLNNLFSKKSRTILTSVASSIGIIGISLVLSLSFGLTTYIDDLQHDMLSGNPIVITESAIDLNVALDNMGPVQKAKIAKEAGYVNVDRMIEEIATSSQTMGTMLVQNIITENYIKYLEDMPEEHLAALFFNHELDVSNNIYFDFKQNEESEPRGVSFTGLKTIATDILKANETTKPFAGLASQFSSSIREAPNNEDYLLDQYDLLDGGKIATEKDEVMLVVSRDRMLADFLLAQLGYYDLDEFVNEVLRVTENEDYDESMSFQEKFTYEQLKDKEFVWYPNDVVFNKETSMTSPFTYNPFMSIDSEDVEADGGIPLKIVGILEPKDNMSYGTLNSGLYYTEALADEIVQQNINSEIVQFLNMAEKDQIESGTTEGLGDFGITFEYSYTYLGTEYTNTGYVGQIDPFSMMLGMMGGPTIEIYVLTLNDLGGNLLPASVAIYPKNLNHKKNVVDYLDAWNGDEAIVVDGVTLSAEDREKVTYTDALSIIFAMISQTINLVTIALIAFTSLALLVSSVMIAIITYVSVVERTNEIGVIRSLGGRKRDVSNLFIAETFIIGLSAGVFAVIITYIGSAIVNFFVVKRIGGNIAIFPWYYALIMIVVSVGLSLISGLIPSRSAAKKDPVDALRAE